MEAPSREPVQGDRSRVAGDLRPTLGVGLWLAAQEDSLAGWDKVGGDRVGDLQMAVLGEEGPGPSERESRALACRCPPRWETPCSESLSQLRMVLFAGYTSGLGCQRCSMEVIVRLALLPLLFVPLLLLAERFA